MYKTTTLPVGELRYALSGLGSKGMCRSSACLPSLQREAFSFLDVNPRMTPEDFAAKPQGEPAKWDAPALRSSGFGAVTEFSELRHLAISLVLLDSLAFGSVLLSALGDNFDNGCRRQIPGRLWQSLASEAIPDTLPRVRQFQSVAVPENATHCIFISLSGVSARE
jgi:hypothetical protein